PYSLSQLFDNTITNNESGKSESTKWSYYLYGIKKGSNVKMMGIISYINSVSFVLNMKNVELVELIFKKIDNKAFYQILNGVLPQLFKTVSELKQYILSIVENKTTRITRLSSKQIIDLLMEILSRYNDVHTVVFIDENLVGTESVLFIPI